MSAGTARSLQLQGVPSKASSALFQGLPSKNGPLIRAAFTGQRFAAGLETSAKKRVAVQENSFEQRACRAADTLSVPSVRRLSNQRQATRFSTNFTNSVSAAPLSNNQDNRWIGCREVQPTPSRAKTQTFSSHQSPFSNLPLHASLLCRHPPIMKKAGKTIAHCTCLAPGVSVREMDMVLPPPQLEKPMPNHLLVLVSGINSTYKDWKFSKEQLQKKLGDAVVIHASEASPGKKTLEGVDVTGLRLAEEVKAVVQANPGLTRISFVGHSLGGLIARYAIAVLYKDPSSDRGVDVTAPTGHKREKSPSLGEVPENSGEAFSDAETFPDASASGQHADEAEQLIDDPSARTEGTSVDASEEQTVLEHIKGKFKIGSNGGAHKRLNRAPSKVRTYSFIKPSGKVTIAGLKPVHFITMATPHLGCRGNKQLPFLLGIKPLESLGPKIAHIAIGETGRHLFLSDGTDDEPPLLLKMTRDTDLLPFMSALGAFELRIAYANSTYDHLVGWRTSCIRREGELPKLPKKWPDEKYKFVMGVEDCPANPLSERDGGSSSGSARSASFKSAESEPSDVPASEEGHVAPHLEGVPVEQHGQPPPLNPATESQDWGSWSGKKTHTETLEEEMIAGLQQVPWRKVDVSFNGAYLPMFAHFSIQVKVSWLHWEGEAVVSHLADTLLRSEGILPPEPEAGVKEVGAQSTAVAGSAEDLTKEAQGEIAPASEARVQEQANV